MRIYVHIPFCAAKCNYCDFLSFAGIEQTVQTAYKDALITEINAADIKQPVLSVYIGGGTPTVISAEYLTEIIAQIKNKPLCENAEFTVEANPGTVNKESLLSLIRAGVNRLSIGMQTSNAYLLKTLGRVHTHSDSVNAFNQARAAGFENISIDLMYALPGQSAAYLKTDIKKVISLHPEHISAYPLTYEPGTPFADIPQASDETARAMYEIVNKELAAAGYEHYEISNWARQGFYSKHNTGYWMRDEYLGFGLGAHSFTGAERYSNITDLREYIKSKQKKLPSSICLLSKTDAMEEFIFLGLRLLKGINLDKFKSEFGEAAEVLYETGIKRMIKEGLAVKNGNNLRLTNNGVFVSNYVLANILTVREQPRS